MAICSFHCQKKFVKSTEGVFKVVEVIVGFGCWGLLYFGDAMLKGNDVPQVNDEVLLLTLTSLPAWLITCATYLFFLLSPPTKCSLCFDAVLNGAFAFAYAASTGICATSRDFVWLCVTSKGQAVDQKYCDSPLRSVFRNGGQNLALIVFGAVLSGMYLTHFIFLFTKLCSSRFIPNERADVDFEPVNL